jgi:hypothetical protein
MKHRRNAHLIEAIFHKPWFITSSGYAAVRRLADAKLRGENGDWTGMMESGREPMEIDGNGIAHIEICGTLSKNVSPIEACCGAYDYEWLEEDLENAMEAGVRGIWLEIDSPGGACEGCAEGADLIAEAARKIPVVVYSDGTCASAAYNLAVSGTKLFGSQSSTWGSIGTIIPWTDESAMWTEEGLAWDPITNTGGVLKGAGMGPSLTAAQRASLQQYVDDAFSQFKANVLKNRLVPAEAMTGGAYLAPRALDYKLIDGILTESAAYEKLVALVK